jgi:23S rRNA U2552 (ribose-2'-O)-methylase RlmE/FtsJ
MKTPDDTEFQKTVDRVLDRGKAQRRQVRFRLPLVGVDVLSVEDHIVVASFERYLEAAQALEEAEEAIEQDSLDELLSDASPSSGEEDDIAENDQM